MRKFCLLGLFALGGCSAIQINPGAELVRLTKTDPGKECQYLGDITGHQSGNGLMSDVDRETGGRNDLKNKAAAIGGNMVVILTDREERNYYGKQRSVTLAGTVYKCP